MLLAARCPITFPLQQVYSRRVEAGNNDAFVTKLKADGTAPLVYSTYLGGSQDDVGNAIVVDSNGEAYVTGSTLFR